MYRSINSGISWYRQCPDGEHEAAVYIRYVWTPGAPETREDPAEPDELDILFIEEIGLSKVGNARDQTRFFQPRKLFRHDFTPEEWREIEEKCCEDAAERWYSKEID